MGWGSVFRRMFNYFPAEDPVLSPVTAETIPKSQRNDLITISNNDICNTFRIIMIVTYYQFRKRKILEFLINSSV